MKIFILIFSYMPIIISIILAGYFILKNMFRLKAIVLVSLMIFVGLAFLIFIKCYFGWTSNVNLSDVISSALCVIFPLLIFIVLTATEGNQFSIRNLLTNIRNFNFPTIALLLYIAIMNIIIFASNIVKYKM